MSAECKPDESECKPDESEPEHRGARAVLWSSGRRGLVVVAVVVVLAAVVTLVVVSGGGRSTPSGAIPTLDTQFAGESSAPSAAPPPAASPDLPRYSGKPQWTVALQDATPIPTDHGFVVQQKDAVLAVDAAGAEKWRFTPPVVDSFEVRVTGPVVLVGYRNPAEDRWPQPEMVVALDAVTGAELWRDGEASLWSATTDTLYMSVCYGGQNNRIGDCKLSARDPRTNAIRWSVPTYASARVENVAELRAAPTPRYLLVGAYPESGETYHVSSLDPATGETLGGDYAGLDADVGTPKIVAEQTVLTVKGYDDNPADGCAATLTGFTVAGATQTWQYVAPMKKEDDGRRCGRMSESINRGRMGVATANDLPGVLNLGTGVIEWTAPAEGEAIAASDTMLLVVESTPDGAAELVAYQVGNPEPVWRAPYFDSDRVVITDTVAYVFGSEAIGYDLKSGAAWTYGPGVEVVSDTWFAVCENGVCGGYPIA